MKDWIYWLLIILILLFVGLILHGKSSIPFPPKFDYIGCGCEIRPYGKEGTHRGWQTKVWVEYRDGKRWNRLFSVREIHQRKKALLDCNDWLIQLEKARKEALGKN